jgi:hypothetical protein
VGDRDSAGLPDPRIAEVIDRVRFTAYISAHAAGIEATDPSRPVEQSHSADLSDSWSHQDESLSHQETTRSCSSVIKRQAGGLPPVWLTPGVGVDEITCLIDLSANLDEAFGQPEVTARRGCCYDTSCGKVATF